jgi:hypothetical protein
LIGKVFEFLGFGPKTRAYCRRIGKPVLTEVFSRQDLVLAAIFAVLTFLVVWLWTGEFDPPTLVLVVLVAVAFAFFTSRAFLTVAARRDQESEEQTRSQDKKIESLTNRNEMARWSRRVRQEMLADLLRDLPERTTANDVGEALVDAAKRIEGTFNPLPDSLRLVCERLYELEAKFQSYNEDEKNTIIRAVETLQTSTMADPDHLGGRASQQRPHGRDRRRNRACAAQGPAPLNFLLRVRGTFPHAGPRRVALVPIAAALLVAGAGCGSSHHTKSARPSASAAASCVSAVEWQGATYFGTKVNQPARLARDLGTGTRPACDDGGGSTAASSVRLAAIAGVPPEQALAIARDPSVVYVEPSYFTQVPHTSLHDLIFGAEATMPNERSECERGHTTTADVRAVVRGAGFGTMTVTLLDPTNLPRKNWIFPDARTIIMGGGSTPRVTVGDVVRARVLVCRHANDSHFLKLVATHLELPSSE